MIHSTNKRLFRRFSVLIGLTAQALWLFAAFHSLSHDRMSAVFFPQAALNGQAEQTEVALGADFCRGCKRDSACETNAPASPDQNHDQDNCPFCQICVRPALCGVLFFVPLKVVSVAKHVFPTPNTTFADRYCVLPPARGPPVI